MSKKTITAIAATAALLLLLLILYFTTDVFKKPKDFAVKDVSQITRITIEKDSSSITLDKKNGHWIINEKGEVKSVMINQLLYFIQNVEVSAPIPNKANSIADSLFNDGFLITVESNDKVIKQMTIAELPGKVTGTIGRIEGCKSGYILHVPGSNFSIASIMTVNVQLWNKNLLLSLLPNEIVSVKVDNIEKPASSFKIYRGTDGQFHLLDVYNEREVANFNPEQLDFYLSFYTELGYKEQVNMDEYDFKALVLSQPAAIITISSTTGQNEQLKLFLKPAGDDYDAVGRPLAYDKDNLYVVFDGDKKAVLARWIDYDLLLKDVSFFLITN